MQRSKSEITLVVKVLEGAADGEPSNSLKGKTLLAQVDYERVEILHNFVGGRDDELELLKGDVVHVTGKGADGWCLGKCQRTGKLGMFPGVFATRIAHGPEITDALYAELEQMK